MATGGNFEGSLIAFYNFLLLLLLLLSSLCPLVFVHTHELYFHKLSLDGRGGHGMDKQLISRQGAEIACEAWRWSRKDVIIL